MTMHKAFYLRDDVDKLYISRKEDDRGPASTEDNVDVAKKRKP